MVLIAVYWYLAIKENKKRDASGILEGFDHAYEDDLTDKKVCKTLETLGCFFFDRTRLILSSESTISLYDLKDISKISAIYSTWYSQFMLLEFTKRPTHLHEVLLRIYEPCFVLETC